MKTFPLSVILSVHLNRLVAPFDEYREFLSYMCKTSVPIWDVERARREAADTITKQFPALKTAKMPEKTDNGSASRYVRYVGDKLGYHEADVKPIRAKFTVRTCSQAIK